MLASRISVSGMKAQAVRLRVVSENLANADSLANKAGEDPYQRKMVGFKNVLDKELGVKTVRANKIIKDKSAFGKRYEPNHPAAGKDGYIQLPNVNSLVEIMDMKEAQRSYEANLKVMSASKDMLAKTVQIMK